MSRLLVVVLVLVATLMAAAFPARAQPRAGARPDASQALQVAVFADFNGDGPTDLAVGAPTENFGATVDAGAVGVFDGIATGIGLPSASQTLVQDNPEAGDQFGSPLSAKVLGGGAVDLAVGAPGEDVGATVDAGAANLLSNPGTGLLGVSGQALLQANIEAGDRFGAALDV